MVGQREETRKQACSELDDSRVVRIDGNDGHIPCSGKSEDRILSWGSSGDDKQSLSSVETVT